MASTSYPVASSAKELGDSSNALREAVTRIEKAFGSYGFGVEAALEVADDPRIRSVAYQRIHGKWRLTADDSSGVIELSEASRPVIIAAIKHLSPLFGRVQFEAARLRESIESVLPEATELAEKLERDLPK